MELLQGQTAAPQAQAQAVQGRAITQHFVDLLRLSPSAQPCCRAPHTGGSRLLLAMPVHPLKPATLVPGCSFHTLPLTGSQTAEKESEPSVTGSGLQEPGKLPTIVIHHRCGHEGGSLRWKEHSRLEQRHLLLFAPQALRPPLPSQLDG